MTAPEVPDPRVVLARHGLAAKKSWGQNFLVDASTHDTIVRAAAPAPEDWVVEIGAGLGTLTARLAAATPQGRVLAVERDRDMAVVLRGELASLAHVEIREENALRFDYAAARAAAGRPLVVVGNLPYQIASVLLLGLVAARGTWERAVVMVQKEVAERLTAPPGGKTYGALTALIGLWADVRPVVRVRAGAFHPRPKVESTVVRLDALPGGRVPVADPARYRAVVNAAFGQRRKTLRNALRSLIDDAPLDAALAATGIDGMRRGETLSVAELAALANALPLHA